MKLHYTNDIDDLVAFQRFHFERSPGLRSQKYWIGLVMGVVAVVLVLALNSFQFGRSTIIACVVAFVACMVYGVLSYPRRIERAAKKVLGAGGNAAFLGPRDLILESDTLVERSSSSEMRITSSTIERVEKTVDHVFIYIGAAVAVVIPRARVSQSEADAFLEELSRRIKGEPAATANAGSRPSSGDSSVSETPSSLGPRG